MISSADFFGKARMRVDRDAAAVVADRDAAVGGELDLDARRVAGDGLVHRVVDRLGGEVVQRPLVGAADIHAGPAANRLQPFEDFDILGRVAVGRLWRNGVEEVGHLAEVTGRLEPGASRMQYLQAHLQQYVGAFGV